MPLVAFVNVADTSSITVGSPAEEFLKAHNELLGYIANNPHTRKTDKDISESDSGDGISVYIFFVVSSDKGGLEAVPYIFELTMSNHILPASAIPRAEFRRDKAISRAEHMTGVEIEGVIKIHYIVDGGTVASVDDAVTSVKRRIDKAVETN
jgi:hypothetical protein